MGQKSGVGIFVVAAVVVIWLFAFGGIGFIAGLFGPTVVPPGETLSSSITSIAGGATASVVVSSDGRTAEISDTSAQFGAVATVTITITVKHLVTQPTSFQLTVDNGLLQVPAGGTYNLVLETGTPLCPDITYTNTGGSVTPTSQPCGVSVFLDSGDAGTVIVMAMTMNTAIFGATATGNSINFVIHGTGTDPLTVTWSITG